jgi:uncharacterized protein (TIGR04141 family)
MSSETLTMSLLRKGVREFDDALEDAKSVQRFSIKRDSGPDGILCVRPLKRLPAQWVSFVRAGVDGNLDDQLTQSTAAVLFLRVEGRIFAITFGYGHALLKADVQEPNFGLRVALNTVDAAKLRSVDAKTIEELTIHTRRQTSKNAPLGTFGLNVSHDLLRAVTGKPKDSDFASRVTGRDALVITCDVTIATVSTKCKELLKAYKAKDYKEHFSWIDQLATVRDRKVLADLGALLVMALNKKKLDRIHLAPPDIVDYDAPIEFHYSGGERRERDKDIDIERYLASRTQPVTVESLAKDSVAVYGEGEIHPKTRWAIIRCIAAEIQHNSATFVLSGSDWYEVATELSKKVRKELDSIEVTKIALPDARGKEDEGKYNKRAAAGRNDLALLDRKNVKCDGAFTPIEVCDLLTKKKQFVHVKHRASSSTLSHLAAQGTVSARAFLEDAKFRANARAEVRKANKKLVNVIPEGKPALGEYEVVYAIIGRPSKNWRHELPFFTQLHITNAATFLGNRGMKVSLHSISNGA